MSHTQNAIAPAANATTATGRIIPIRKKLNIPPEGPNNGKFIDLNLLPEDQDQAGKPRQLLRLDVQLEALDLKGKPFVVSKFYNLLGRGLEILNDDLHDWCGLDLVPEQGEEFDTSAIVGQPVTVELTNRRQGKQWHTTINAFHPVPSSVPKG